MDQAQQQNAKAQMLNDRTYQEVEYLKKNLGPILVAALAEICIRRPADPIEYLGHWLLRWRYNEELKRRDVQNALEVVRQKAWTKDDETLAANAATSDQPPAPQTFTQGFIPETPYTDASQMEQVPPGEEAQPPADGTEQPPAEGAEPAPGDSEKPSEAPIGEAGTEEKRGSAGGAEKRDSKEKRPSQGAAVEGAVEGERRPSQAAADEKRASADKTGLEGRRGSAAGAEGKRPSTEKKKSGEAAQLAEVASAMPEKRKSGGSEKRASVDLKQPPPETPQEDANNPEAAPAPSEAPVAEGTGEAEPAPAEA